MTATALQASQEVPCLDRPLRTAFVLTSMPVGGQEVLLMELVRGFDRSQILPEVYCLKEKGPLGEQLAREVRVYDQLLARKYDVFVISRLSTLFRRRQIDAVVTVGCGDKMFWGRLAARRARVPVVICALHSTGWPDNVGWWNRRLTHWTDAFVGVASAHGQHLIQREKFPAEKVMVIRNGIDTNRFACSPSAGLAVREQLCIPMDAPVAVVVAALRPEKNHARFLRIAAEVHVQRPQAHFLIVGDGPEKSHLQELARQLGLEYHAHFLGNRSDVPQVLSAADVFLLTSDNEASPVSILEAMACELPVIASCVGSVPESVLDGETGHVIPPHDESQFALRLAKLFDDPNTRHTFGRRGREEVIRHGSRDAMVAGYADLIHNLWRRSRVPRIRQKPV